LEYWSRRGEVLRSKKEKNEEEEEDSV